MYETQFSDFRLSTYQAVRIDLPPFAVTSEEVQTDMRRIALRHATTVAINPRDVKADDMLRIDICTTEDGKEFGGLTKKSVDIQLGIGTLPEELEIALLGHRPGDTVTAAYSLKAQGAGPGLQNDPDPARVCGTTDNDGASGQLVSTVEILELRELVAPDLTDEWVKEHIALADTVEQFYERTARRLASDKKKQYLAQAPYLVMEQLGNRLLGEVPAGVIQSLVQQLDTEFKRFLEQQKLDLETYLRSQRTSRDDYYAHLYIDAEQRIRQDIALMSYARYHGLAVTDQDVNASFLLPTPEKTSEARQNADQSGLTSVFRDLALRSKSAEHATRNSIFVDANGEEDKQFSEDLVLMFHKQQAVREHATAAPMRAQLG